MISLHVAWVAIVLLSLPLALNMIPPNRSYGFRTASTLANPEVWRRANIFAGRTYSIAAIFGLAITVLCPEFADAWRAFLLVGILIAATLISLFHLKRIAP